MVNNKKITVIKGQLSAFCQKIKVKNSKVTVNLGVMLIIFVLLSQREISFKIGHHSNSNKTAETQQASMIPTSSNWWEKIKTKQPTIEDKLNLANPATAVGAALTEQQQKEASKYSNLGFVLNPKLGKKLNVSPEVIQYKKQKCLDYVKKYAPIAIEEMELYGIPASITLAQGLVESNAGESKLSINENNHFGIKCKTKCLGCRCANYTDDDKYDMFRIFETPWYSFREHSKLLTGKRYRHLLKLEITDYKNWSRGLQSAGYATNKKYAKTLIAVIEKMKLYKYDIVE